MAPLRLARSLQGSQTVSNVRRWTLGAGGYLENVGQIRKREPPMSRSIVTKSLAAAAIMGLFAAHAATAQQTQPRIVRPILFIFPLAATR